MAIAPEVIASRTPVGPPSQRRRRLAAAVPALALVLGGVVAAPAQALPAFPQVTFTVADEHGTPVAGVEVMVWQSSWAAGETPAPLVSELTDVTGAATFFGYGDAGQVGTEPWGPGSYLTPGDYAVAAVPAEEAAYEPTQVAFSMPPFTPASWSQDVAIELPPQFALPTDFGLTVDCSAWPPVASFYATPQPNPYWGADGLAYVGFVDLTVNGSPVLHGEWTGTTGLASVQPVPASLRSGDVLSLTIGFNDHQVTASATIGCTPPSNANSRYVSRVYTDLFHRSPDPAGLAYWAGALTAGTPRVAVANSITYSSEYRTGLITGSYEYFLLRSPDAGGLAYWLSMMRAGWTKSQMEAGFLASQEYYDLAGGTPADWVATLYWDVLDREPTDADVGYWVGRLMTGMPRSAVAFGFLLSTERLNTIVAGFYQDLLGRGIDVGGQAYWVRILQAGGRDEAIIGGIIASDEYYGRS